MFIFENGSKTMQWKMDKSVVSIVKQFNILRKQIEKEFNVKIKTTPIIYDPIQSDIDTSADIDGNKLNRSNLAKYWNLLEKHSTINTMYFSIGDIVSDKPLSKKYEKYFLFELNGKTLQLINVRKMSKNFL